MITPYYLMQPGDGTRPITTAELRSPRVAGDTIRTRGTWGPTWPGPSVKRAEQSGKMFTLLLMGGFDNDPTKRASIDLRLSDIKALAGLHGDSPSLAAVHVPTITPRRDGEDGASEELYCGQPMPQDFIAANIEMVDVTASLFQNVPLMLAITDQDVQAQAQIARRGLRKAKAGFLVKFNSLSERTSLDSPHVRLQIQLCLEGAMLGFEFSRQRSSSQFRTAMRKAQSISDACRQPISYVGFYRGNIGDLR